MSLSVPYVLRAAVEFMPDAVVGGLGTPTTVATVDAASARHVADLLAAGYGPGVRHRVVGVDGDATLARLAAARIGVVLAPVDEPGPPVAGHLDVLEQRVWSDTVLLETHDGRRWTHGDFLADLAGGAPDPRWPADLVLLVRELQAPEDDSAGH